MQKISFPMITYLEFFRGKKYKTGNIKGGGSASGQPAGFTLLELIVVIIIIGFMSAMIIPTIGGSINNLKLKTASKRVSAALRYARNQAVSQKKTYLATFDFEKNSLSLKKKVKESQEPEEEITKKPEIKTYYLPEGVKIEKVVANEEEVDSGLFHLIFFPYGGSSGGTITLTGNRDKTYNIEVDFITGLVKLIDDRSY